MDLYPEDGSQFVFSRKLMSGRSICKINGETCSASVMQKAGEYLLDIHGQHEHQTLTKPARQLEIVDDYAKEAAQPVKAEVRALYEEYVALKKELDEVEMDEERFLLQNLR